MIRRKFDFSMKFEDILAIFLGIIFGCFLGFTKFDLPLSMQTLASESSVNDQTWASKMEHWGNTDC